VEQANLQPDQTVVNAYRKELQQLMGIGNSLKEGDGGDSNIRNKRVVTREIPAPGTAPESPPHTEEGGPDDQTPNDLMETPAGPTMSPIYRGQL
jgi:hypothetical protein